MADAPTSVPGALQMTDEQLELEAERGRLVGLISVLTVAMFSGFILTSYFALRDAASADQAKHLAAISEHKLAYILSGFFLSIGSLLVAAVLVHILLAARSRSTVVPRLALFTAIAGPVLVALVFPVYTITQVSAANDFAAAAQHTVAVAKHVTDTTAISSTSLLYFVGQAVLGIAWLLTGIYGMRLGLLTRLIGTVAIAIGAANLLAPPFAALLEVFWIGAVAILLLGESASTPPAWKLGRPVPWTEVAAIAARQSAGEDASGFNKSEQ